MNGDESFAYRILENIVIIINVLIIIKVQTVFASYDSFKTTHLIPRFLSVLKLSCPAKVPVLQKSLKSLRNNIDIKVRFCLQPIFCYN